MTYITGGNVQAADYNTFATLSASMNEVYADLHAGTTTIAAGADYGYGKTALVPVVAGNSITASQWGLLFDSMRNSGTHQNTTVSPPVPGSNPSAGSSTIAAFNSPATMAATVSLLRTNRHNLFAGQTSLNIGTTYSSVSTWLTLLTYTFQANFSSWDNARYFFNSGGSLQIIGAYPGAASPIELAWQTAISSPKAPFTFNWNSTSPATGTNDAPLNPIGFWKESTGNPLTTSYQIIYYKALGAGYYTSSFVQIEAKLTNIAGTNGLVDFKISLIDGDPTPNLKSVGINFTVNNATSAGAVVYPGPAVIITNGGYTYT